MSNNIQKLQKLIKFARVSNETNDHSDLLSELRQIKDTLTNFILTQQSLQIREMMGKDSLSLAAALKGFVPTEEPQKPKETTQTPQAISKVEALDNLEKITTTKKDKNGKRAFLLHRPTDDFEYQKYAKESQYITTQSTEWVAEIELAEESQKARNPVVSCFISEDSIDSLVAPDNTGTWNELGQNPHTNKFTISVKPGKYYIYRELAQ